MSVTTPPRAIALAVLLTLALSGAGAARAAERTLTLEEAIASALENNDGIRIERESLLAATAAVSGAKGATTRCWSFRGDGAGAPRR